MCACSWNYVCLAHRDTRHDPGYWQVDDHEQPEPEEVRPAEYEVRDA